MGTVGLKTAVLAITPAICAGRRIGRPWGSLRTVDQGFRGTRFGRSVGSPVKSEETGPDIGRERAIQLWLKHRPGWRLAQTPPSPLAG